ncbi:MAG: DUF6785 family protein [Candidatus Hodarchaeota archaeon]
MEKERYLGFTLKATVIALIVFFLLVFYRAPGNTFHRSIWLATDDPVYNHIETQSGEWYGSIFLFGTMSLIILIIALVNKLSRKVVFNGMETAVITLVIPIIVLIESAWAIPMSIVNLITYSMGTYVRGYDYEKLFPLLSPILGPQDISIYDAMLPAGGSINWVAWAPTTLWAIVFALSITLTTFFSMLLVRRVWVHEERLTFPYASYQNEIIELTQVDETGQVKFWKQRYFLIGLIIGIVWMIPTHLQLWWSPTNNQGRMAVQQVGHLWVNGPYAIPWWGLAPQVENILPYSPLYVNLMPWAIGWGFLNSIPNLVGLVVISIAIVIVLPLVAYNAGMLSPYSAHPRTYPVYMNYMWGRNGFGDFPLGICIALGMLLGITFYPLWRNRSHYVQILTALFRKTSPELETESPIPYRLVWIGLIASFVIWVAAGVAINVPVLTYLCYAALITLFSLAAVRLVCETGAYFGYHLMQRWPNYGHVIFLGYTVLFLTGAWGEQTASNLAAVMSIGTYGAIPFFAYHWAYRGGWISTHTSKIATDQKLDLKKVFRFVILLIVISFVVGFMFDLWLIGALGINMPPTGIYQTSIFWDGRVPDIVNSRLVTQGPASGPSGSLGHWTTNLHLTLGTMAIGFLIIVTTYFLRGRFTWFLVGPAGIALGALLGYQIWVSWLVALLIKYLVIRVGGMKMYKEKALPFFIGSLFAWFIVVFFGDLGSAFSNEAFWG